MKAIINNEVEIEVEETITGFCNSDIVSIVIPDASQQLEIMHSLDVILLKRLLYQIVLQ